MNRNWAGWAGFSCMAALLAACGGGDEDPSGAAAGGAAAGGLVGSGGAGTGGAGTGGASTGGAGTGGSGAGGTGGTSFGVDCAGDYAGIETCAATPTRAALKPANVLVVLDKSGSMGLAGKWEQTMAAVNRALVDLQAYAQFGLVLFPARDVPRVCVALDGSNDTCCNVASAVDVPLGPGAETAPAIAALLCGADGICSSTDDPIGPSGRTPTAKALTLARTYLEGAGVLADPSTPSFVFIVTDGGPNCDATATCAEAECTVNIDEPSLYAGFNQCEPTQPTTGPELCLDLETDGDGPVGEISALAAAGVSTVVIGIPGSDKPAYIDVLNQMAVAGGRPKVGADTSYYRVGADQNAIRDVFIEIASELITTCDIALAAPPFEASEVNVAVECELVPQVGDTGVTQWTLEVAGDSATLHLFDELCARAEAQGIGKIDVLYGCPAIG